jgi:hypothetical protein
MKNNLFAFCLLAILISCNNETPKTETAQATAVRPEFVVENYMDTTMDIPHSYVSIKNGGSVVRVDTTTGSFQLMNDAEKAQEKMPVSYIIAGSAFWAGLKEIIVIDSSAEGYTVKRQFQDSEVEGAEPFEVVKKFPK